MLNLFFVNIMQETAFIVERTAEGQEEFVLGLCGTLCFSVLSVLFYRDVTGRLVNLRINLIRSFAAIQRDLYETVKGLSEQSLFLFVFYKTLVSLRIILSKYLSEFLSVKNFISYINSIANGLILVGLLNFVSLNNLMFNLNFVHYRFLFFFSRTLLLV